MCMYRSDSESSIQCLSWPHASHSPSTPTPSLPKLFTEMFFQSVRACGNIVLLVKYNIGSINITTHGRRTLTKEISSIMQLYSENSVLDYDSVSDRFSCPQYSSRFSFKQGLNGHWKRIHGNSLDTLASPTCNKEGKVITCYQGSSAPFRNTMLFSLQYSTALDVTLLISTR